MKRPLIATAFFVIILTSLSAPTAGQQTGDAVAPPFSNAPYLVGERLTYNISYSSFSSAGYLELVVGSHATFFGRDAIELRAHLETTGVVSAALYALNNDYTSYVDPATGLPFRSREVVREASRQSDESNDFNQPASAPGRSGEFPGTYDFLSALYRLRAMPLTDGSNYSLTVRRETQEYQAELRVRGHQMIRTSVGSFNAIVAEIRAANNSAVNDYHIHIYFSDDERHVPLLITAKPKSGEIRVEIAASQLPRPKPGGKGETLPPPPVATPTPVPPPATTGPRSADSLANVPFKIGEQLNYRVYLGTAQEAVGQATFQVRSRGKYFNNDGLMLTVSAQTTNAAQRVFSANDQLTSYIDLTTLLPFHSEWSLVEGRRRSKSTFVINQDRGSISTDTGQRIEIPVGTHDYVSLFYALRTMNLVPPKRNALSILVNGRAKTLFITALRRETIQIGSQKINAIQISLTTDDPQGDKYALRGWISDDDRHLPLRLTATTELGQLRAELVILGVTRQ